MALVSAPNGSVFDLDDAIASGLVGSVDSGWDYVEVDGEMVLADLKIAELKAHAVDYGIDLGAATKKADILTAIQAATEPATPVPAVDVTPDVTDVEK